MHTAQSVTLRQATVADSPLVYAMKKAAMKGYIEQVWGEWDEQFQQEYHRTHFDPAVTRVICCEKREVGSVVLREYPEYLMLESLHIVPEYQNRGIGGWVIGEELEKAGRVKSRVRLHVLKINPVVGLYKRMKFRIIGELDKHYVMEWGGSKP